MMIKPMGNDSADIVRMRGVRRSWRDSVVSTTAGEGDDTRDW